MRVVESLNHALHELMEKDPTLIILGEDILDPYGGAFKVTKGLSTAYPDRVWTTPISEGGIIGMAVGLAIKGNPVIAELMFGDSLHWPLTSSSIMRPSSAGCTTTKLKCQLSFARRWAAGADTGQHIRKVSKSIFAVCLA